jgi:hypothetical protein
LFHSFCRGYAIRRFLQAFVRWPDYDYRGYHPSHLFLTPRLFHRGWLESHQEHPMLSVRRSLLQELKKWLVLTMPSLRHDRWIIYLHELTDGYYRRKRPQIRSAEFLA